MNTLCMLTLCLISLRVSAMNSPASPSPLSYLGSPDSLTNALSPTSSTTPLTSSLNAYALHIPAAQKILSEPYPTAYKSLRAIHDILMKYSTRFTRGPIWSSVQARLGDVYRCNAQSKEAEIAYLKAWSHFVEYPLAKAWAGTQLGYIYITKKEYNKATQYFNYAVMHGAPEYMPKVLNGLGVAHFNDNNIEKAHECWTQILEGSACKEQARVYYNDSRYYEKKGEFAKALVFLKKSRELGHILDEKDLKEYVTSLSKSLSSQ